MKITPQCMICLFERAGYACDLCTENVVDPKALRPLKTRALKRVLDFLSENMNEDSVPAVLGTKRERIICETMCTPDAYVRIKTESNETGKRLLKTAREWMNAKINDAGCDPLTLALTVSAAGNSVEFGVKGHDFDLESFEEGFIKSLENSKKEFDIDGILDAITRHEGVLLLTDNAGEIFLDMPLIEYLNDAAASSGKKVTICPKSGPILNDATIADVELLDLPNGVRVLPTGRFIGMSLEEGNPEFLKAFWDPKNLVIAKGMGNYETISDFDSDPRLADRLVYILKAKCIPIAEHIGVPHHCLVAILKKS